MLDFKKYLFAICDFSNDLVSLAVFDNGSVIFSHHSRHDSLLDSFNLAKSKANIKLPKFDFIITTNGPGSFTAIRQNLAFIYGLNAIIKKPVYNINCLLATASPLLLMNKPVGALIRGYQNELFAASYLIFNNKIVIQLEIEMYSAEKIWELIPTNFQLIGSGLTWLQKKNYQSNLSKYQCVEVANYNLAEQLGHLIINYNLVLQDYIYPEPYYVKLPIAEINYQSKK